MDNFKFPSFLLSHPFSKYINKSAKNELETFRSSLFCDQPIGEIVTDFLEAQKTESANKSTQNSERHRTTGNQLFRTNKKKNAIEASRCYTDAIIAAQDGSRELALAHANRAASLAELGYYKEAYEDCVCAIANGYPNDNLEKIVSRQAFCANKLEECDKLSDCLEKLRTMSLSKPFAEQKAAFEEDLIRLSKHKVPGDEALSKDSCITQKILYNPEKGRYLATSEDIDKGEVVLMEKAFALVPVDKLKICAKCGAQHIIPFPCNICSKVFYCSLKCKTAHEKVHGFECYAYEYGVIPKFGLLHLAMNTLLTGLPSIVDKLKHLEHENEIWEAIEAISRSGDKGYAEVLSLATNFQTARNTERKVFFAHCNGIVCLTFYLMKFTSFFDLFKDTNCAQHQWAAVTSALFLKHVLQMMFNASTSSSLFPIDEMDLKIEFLSLSDVWEKPFHLRRGRLRMFSFVRQTYAGIFPHLSVCNHSCEPSFRTKFEGNCVVAYARRQLKQGTEIHNAYVPDFKNNLKAVRKADLKKLYCFDCKCKHCSDDDRDAGYLQFYRYRCQNTSCKAIFVPRIEKQEWWLEEAKIFFITCPSCQSKLNVEWYWVFFELIDDPSAMSKMIEIFKSSERFLVGHSELRIQLCEVIAQTFVDSIQVGKEPSITECNAVGEAVKYWLDVVEQKYDVKSLMYIAKATLALDIMAYGKYSDFDCKKIRTSFDMLSTEMKAIFTNYVSDYIGEKFYASD